MSQSHNIAGSDAFRTGPIVMIQQLPRRRPRLPLLARWFIGAAVLGAAASVLDIITGQPIALAAACLAFLVLWLRA
mgnify:CR=1 FL=1